MGYIDLHVHSKYSDGKMDIKDLLDIASNNNVSVISFTEHYNLSSLRVAKKLVKGNTKYNGIEVIPGIEIGANMQDIGLSNHHVCHILAYFVSPRIYEILSKYEEDRKKTNEKIIERLKNQGINITYGKILKYTKKKSFGRYDIAIKVWDLSIDRRSNNPKAYVERARVKKKIGDITGYNEDIAKAREYSPTIDIDESITNDALHPKMLTLTIK